jgi:hypothetical protein
MTQPLSLFVTRMQALLEQIQQAPDLDAKQQAEAAEAAMSEFIEAHLRGERERADHDARQLPSGERE